MSDIRDLLDICPVCDAHQASTDGHRPTCPRDEQQRLRAEVEATENWYIEELERLRERAPA